MRSHTPTHRRAKTLRGRMSPAEVLLWMRLRERRPERPSFRRQHPIGPYIADFYCAAARLVVEIDGADHSEEAQVDHDERRDAYMTERGYRVLRCPAAGVLEDPDAAAWGILQSAAELIEGDR
ncbi:MAG: endonuclease domain-containing protein [Caulobacteraceae bacterium]